MMQRARTICFGLLASIWLASNSLAVEPVTDPLPKIKEKVEAEKAVLVDVREKSEWDEGHVKGAIWLPLSRLEKEGAAQEALKQLPKDKVLYIHCRTGRRSLKAANILEPLGLDVRPIEPGYKELISAGFPKAEQ